MKENLILIRRKVFLILLIHNVKIIIKSMFMMNISIQPQIIIQEEKIALLNHCLITLQGQIIFGKEEVDYLLFQMRMTRNQFILICKHLYLKERADKIKLKDLCLLLAKEIAFLFPRLLKPLMNLLTQILMIIVTNLFLMNQRKESHRSKKQRSQQLKMNRFKKCMKQIKFKERLHHLCFWTIFSKILKSNQN